MDQDLVVQALGYCAIGQGIAALLYLSQNDRFPTPMKDYLRNDKELSDKVDDASAARRQLYMRGCVTGMGLVTLYLVYSYGKKEKQNVTWPAVGIVAAIVFAGNVFNSPTTLKK